MSRRTRIMVAVLAVCLIGLVIDHLFIGPPAPAEATAKDTHDGASSRNTPAPKASVLPQNPQVIDETLAWLGGLPDTRTVRDVFALRGGFLSHTLEREEADLAKAADEAGEAPLETFAATHVLQSTLIGPKRRLATINNAVYGVGDAIGEFRLEDVQAGNAVFRHGPTNRQVILLLDGIRP